jgi:GcrA cell cycle regulator
MGGVSRNSVVGKVSRLGLSGHKIGRKAEKPIEAPTPIPLPRASVVDDIPVAQRKTIFELANHNCRWPIGDPKRAGFFFCGSPDADLAQGMPYCPIHSRRAYAAPSVILGRA